MTTPLDETFRHNHGFLEVTRTPRSGKTYTQHCDYVTFRALVNMLELFAVTDEAFTLPVILDHVQGHPMTQIAVALAFLKERGIVVPTGVAKTSMVAEGYRAGLYEDAMCEWHALYEEVDP